MMQMYVKGSCKAAQFYQEAFDAKLVIEYKNDDGSYMHAELDAFGQILAISEAADEKVSGNTMQFCFHFEESEIEKVKHAYEVLKDGAEILCPLGECSYSKCMFALIDKFGVSWCLFTE
jgi:PhnB protein